MIKMEVNVGDLIILTYEQRQYSVFVKRIDGDTIVCSEQMTPQYIQEIFISKSRLIEPNVKVLSRFNLTN